MLKSLFPEKIINEWLVLQLLRFEEFACYRQKIRRSFSCNQVIFFPADCSGPVQAVSTALSLGWSKTAKCEHTHGSLLEH